MNFQKLQGEIPLWAIYWPLNNKVNLLISLLNAMTFNLAELSRVFASLFDINF